MNDTDRRLNARGANMHRMPRRRAIAVAPIVAILAICATRADGGLPVDVITPESAALLMPVLQKVATGKLNMNTFLFKKISSDKEGAWVETERVPQSDGALRWRYLYCWTAPYPGSRWMCKADSHRALRVGIGDDGKSADISIDEDIDAAETRAVLLAAVRELGRTSTLTPCGRYDQAVRGSFLLDEIRQFGEGQLHREGGEYSLGNYATAYFGYETDRQPQVNFRCLKQAEVLE